MVGDLVYVPCRLARNGDQQIIIVEDADGERVPVPRGGLEIVQALFCMVGEHLADLGPDRRRVRLIESGVTVVVRPMADIDQWRPADHFTRKKARKKDSPLSATAV